MNWHDKSVYDKGYHDGILAGTENVLKGIAEMEIEKAGLQELREDIMEKLTIKDDEGKKVSDFPDVYVSDMEKVVKTLTNNIIEHIWKIRPLTLEGVVLIVQFEADQILKGDSE